MAKANSAPARKTTIQQASGIANKMDAALAVIFLGLALYNGWWFWWVSAAFCAVTAYTSPLEKLGNWLTKKIVKTKR